MGGGGKIFIVKNCLQINISLGYSFPMHENYIQPTSSIIGVNLLVQYVNCQINYHLRFQLFIVEKCEVELYLIVGLNKTSKTLKSYHFKHEGQFP